MIFRFINICCDTVFDVNIGDYFYLNTDDLVQIFFVRRIIDNNVYLYSTNGTFHINSMIISSNTVVDHKSGEISNERSNIGKYYYLKSELYKAMLFSYYSDFDSTYLCMFNQPYFSFICRVLRVLKNGYIARFVLKTEERDSEPDDELKIDINHLVFLTNDEIKLSIIYKGLCVFINNEIKKKVEIECGDEAYIFDKDIKITHTITKIFRDINIMKYLFVCVDNNDKMYNYNHFRYVKKPKNINGKRYIIKRENNECYKIGVNRFIVTKLIENKLISTFVSEEFMRTNIEEITR